MNSVSNVLNNFVHLQSVAYDLKSGKKRNLLTMKEPRYVHTSILMEKSIYVFGGRNENGYLSSCERYVEYKN